MGYYTLFRGGLHSIQQTGCPSGFRGYFTREFWAYTASLHGCTNGIFGLHNQKNPIYRL